MAHKKGQGSVKNGREGRRVNVAPEGSEAAN